MNRQASTAAVIGFSIISGVFASMTDSGFETPDSESARVADLRDDLAAALDLGRLYYSQITIHNAAKEGALEASRNPGSFDNTKGCDADTNRVDRLEAIGLWMDAPFSGRENDRIAVAIGRTRVNRKLRGGTVRTEYPIELNYSVAVAPWLTLMPNLQHIRQSGQRRSSLNVAGLRVELAF